MAALVVHDVVHDPGHDPGHDAGHDAAGKFSVKLPPCRIFANGCNWK